LCFPETNEPAYSAKKAKVDERRILKKVKKERNEEREREKERETDRQREV
jgi:hypothetical protein